jgi:hypothetical protein
MTVRRAACALSIAALGAAALPAAAGATVSVTSFSVTPSTTQAGGHPDLTVDTSLASDPDTDDVKSLRVVLPQGLVGDPNSAGRCSQSAFAADACPSDSKVGTTTVTATVLGIPQDSAGDVYSLQPVGSEPARLGIIVRPTLGPMPLDKIFLQSPVTLGADTNFGLSTTFDNLPRQAGGFDIRMDRLKLTLNGSVAHGAFVTNPTSCRLASTTTTVTSYDAPGSASATSSFTPTACDRLPFTPTLEGTVSSTPGATNLKPVGVQTTISLPAGQANVRTAVVRLPPILSANTGALNRACTLEQQAAGPCPESSRVGSARAASPLLATPLPGNVYLAATTTGLPKLLVSFTGALTLSLDGTVALGNGIETTFDGLPDLPLSRFDLSLDRSSGLLTTDADLCRPGVGITASARLVSQAGGSLNLEGPLPVLGCGSPGRATPTGALSFAFRYGVGALRARFVAARGGAAIRRLRLVLPGGLSAVGGRAGLGRTQVTAAGRVSSRLLRLRGRRTLEVLLPRKGTTALNVRWTGLTASASLARRLATARTRQGVRLSFAPRITDTTGRATTLRLKVRPG